jgi:hypothetical protein
MILRPDDEESGQPRLGNGIGANGIDLHYLWPRGRIPYEIDPGLPNRRRVIDAVAHWNQRLAGVIQLVPRRNEEEFVTFIRSSHGSCSATVGRGFFNEVELADSCATGNVIHEIGHTVGLWHEQSRNDRDSHIRVLWDNIVPDARNNFSKQTSLGNDIGPYDYSSVMHYSAYSFSRNGQPTIQTIPPDIEIGQREGLSQRDIEGVRRLYSGMAPQPVAAPVISGPSSVSGRVGVEFTFEVSASNSPTSFGATGLPAGLTIDARTGEISGAPRANGSFTVTLTATNAGGRDTSVLTIVVAPANRPPEALEATLHVSSTTIVDGDPVLLTWTTDNATTVTITPDPGRVALNGSRSVTPYERTTYILTARGAAGTVTRTVTVNVTLPPLPAPILRIPAFLSLGAKILVEYPRRPSIVRFEWSFVPKGAPASSSAAARFSQAAAISFATNGSQADLSGQALQPGPYQVSVVAFDGHGRRSAPASAAVTLTSASLDRANVYPNPWRKDRHAQPIVFEELTASTRIKIFTVSGYLVADLGAVSGTASWDLKNSAGDLVASGLYLYVLEAEDGARRRGKLAIVH